jgi:hypothetical protein
MSVEKTYKFSKRLREKYSDKWPDGRPFIYVKHDHPFSGLGLLPIKIRKGLVITMYVCNMEIWKQMPSKMKKGFERIM